MHARSLGLGTGNQDDPAVFLGIRGAAPAGSRRPAQPVASIHSLASAQERFWHRGALGFAQLIILTTDLVRRVQARYRYPQWHLRISISPGDWRRAEGRSCLEFAEARARLHPQSGATWMECVGAYAVFDGVNSPVTQSFGLGLFEALSPAALDTDGGFFPGSRGPCGS